MITLVIDGKQVKVNEDATVLEAAREIDVYIPTLCYHPSLPSDGSCGLCLVEVILFGLILRHWLLINRGFGLVVMPLVVPLR